MIARPYIVTEEQLELDRAVRAGLCTRPASGPDAQSIDEAAEDIATDPRIDVSSPRYRAALAILGPGGPWDRMRSAAVILREAAP